MVERRTQLRRFARALLAWVLGHARHAFGRRIELVAAPPVPEPVRPVRDATDDRVKQRQRKKMARSFIDALDGVADSITGMGVKAKLFDREFGWVRVEGCADLLDLVEKHTDLEFRAVVKTAKSAAQLANLDETSIWRDSDGERGFSLQRIKRAYARDLRSQFPMVVPGAQFYIHTISFDSWKNLCTQWVYLTRSHGADWACMWTEHGRTRIETLTSSEKNEDKPWCSLRFIEGATWQHHLDDVAWCLRMRRGPVKLMWRCTDSIAREMLMLRDSGGRRRDAALHWVTDHDRIVNGEVRRVKAHLRGKKRFTWGRWECSLEEAAFDRDALSSSERLPTSQIETRQSLYTTRSPADAP